jgi:hypothetical protein
MSTQQSEDRALEIMRKELASERMPDLPWDKMERELMARLDDAPMTSQPKSLDARVDDVPVSSVRHPRKQFVQVSFVVFAAAAAFALFWFSPLHSGKRVVISTASPSVVTPASSYAPDEHLTPKAPETNVAPQPVLSSSADVAPWNLAQSDVKSAFSMCVKMDKNYRTNTAAKLKKEKLTVYLEKDGKIATIRFDSPLEPQVMQCVFETLRGGRFVGATKPFTIQF